MKDTKVFRKELPEWREKLGGVFLFFLLFFGKEAAYAAGSQ
jgi:hypothetical protein